jgi:hypothetical protein
MADLSLACNVPNFLRIKERSTVTTFANRATLGFGKPASRHFENSMSPGNAAPSNWLVTIATT